MLPKHTAAILWAGFEDGADFLKKMGRPPEPLWADYVLPWWGNEAAVGLTQPVSEGLEQEVFVVLAARDTALASARLRDYGMRRGMIQVADHQTFVVFQFSEGGLLSPLLGDTRAFVQPACAVLGGYVVFACDVAALERWIDAYVVGETLSASPDFLDMAQRLPTTGCARLYLRTGALPVLAKDVFPDGRHEAAARGLSTLGWLGWDFGAGERGMLNGAFARSSSGEEGLRQAAGLAWRAPLEAEATTAPQAVCCPQAEGAQALLVQDARHELYCLSRAGKVLWRRVLPGPLMGQVEQLDYMGDGSCCYFFNTPDALWVLDAQGRDVRGFPLRLRAKAVNAASVMRTGEHRGFVFFVALENGNVQGFNYLGQPLAGWNPQVLGEAVLAPVLATQRGGQDFIAVLTRSGRLSVCGPEGRLHFPALQWPGPFTAPMAVSAGAEWPAFVAFNERGQGFFCDLKGHSGPLPAGVMAAAGGMACVQQPPGEAGLHWGVWEAGRLRYGVEKKGGWKPLGSAQPLTRPSAIFFPAGGCIGVLHGRERQVSLFLPEGGQRFPGTTPFCLLPMAPGRSLLVVGDGAGVCAYAQ
ncbi:MAG TPA: DUF3352 domain-containing protein [Saprospiraceae bacterium]|nr:DUF3352 domain-containing protein [Saprospiraceae bacterium]